MTFVRENQIIPWQGVYFFTNTVLQNHRNMYCCDENHDKHHIGKKIHTLLKANTQRCHKTRQEYGLKRLYFSTYHSVFFPTVMRSLVGRFDSCFLTNTKKDMTPIHSLISQKYVNIYMCLYPTY